MRIPSVARSNGELLVVGSKVLGQPCFGRFNVVDGRQPHGLAHAVLQRLKQAPNPAFGLGTSCLNGLDAQLQQSALKLGRLGIFWVVCGEDAVAVAVQG